MKKIISKSKKVVAKKKTLSVKKSAPKKDLFEVSLQLGEHNLKAKGPTINDCLKAIAPDFTIKTKGIFVVKKGALKSERVMIPFEIKKLLLSKNDLIRNIFEKRVVAMMK